MIKKPKRIKKISLTEAQKIFNRYRRVKEADKDGYCYCISCGVRKKWNELDAGHFKSVGSSSYLRFNENNVHPQCKPCNSWGGMDIGHKYGEALKNKIGLENFKELEQSQYKTIKYSNDVLRGMVEFWKEETKRFIKEKGL